MKINRRLGTILLLLFISTVNADSVDASNDASMNKQILGTWFSEFKFNDKNHPDSWIKARSVDIYKEGGYLVGSVDYEYSDRADTLTYEGRWEIKDNYLLIEVTQTSGGYLSRGTKTKDKILSFSKSKIELLAEDGKTIVLTRTE